MLMMAVHEHRTTVGGRFLRQSTREVSSLADKSSKTSRLQQCVGPNGQVLPVARYIAHVKASVMVDA